MGRRQESVSRTGPPGVCAGTGSAGRTPQAREATWLVDVIAS